jgi:hypothetical protein
VNRDELAEGLTSLANLAAAMAAYVAQLQEHGFARDEALLIAVSWQTTLLQASAS